MPSKKKKQHYVPQCYLENWAIDSTHQVYVYDKKIQSQRKNNITDVASENCFYDVNLSEILTEDQAREIGSSNYDLVNSDVNQYIENFFSKAIEGKYKTLLNGVIHRVSKMTPWETENCFFLSKEDKPHFSLQLAFQYLRVKAMREKIVESNDCLLQVLDDMKASPEVKERYALIAEHLPYIHGAMILDMDLIRDLSQTFYDHAWILGINKTKQLFITSDSPIGTIPHKSHPYLSMSGLRSSGIEVYFPISPTFILLMYDRDHHIDIAPFERRIIEIDNIAAVNFYNTQNAINCNRCIFSSNGDFTFVQKLLSECPDFLERPHIQLLS